MRGIMVGGDIRVAILEDERLTLESLEHLLFSSGLAVVVAATRAAEFLSALPAARPSVALVDLYLSSRHAAEGSAGGIDVIRQLQREHPEIGVIALSGMAGEQELSDAREAGATTSLDKNSLGRDQLLAAIRASLRGSVDEAFRVRPKPDGLARLTHRELQVLRHLSTGADNLKISSLLGITERTVRAHVSALYRKLQCENRTEMAVLARRLGVKSPELES
jgi:two-component system nitrate/nitrite response regulator NarL